VLAVHRDRLGAIVATVGTLRVQALAVLVTLVALHRSINALAHRSSVEGVGFRRMLLALEVHEGASRSVVGGGGLGTGLRIAMLRSWGVDAVGIGVAVVITSAMPTFAMWLVAGANTLPHVISGDAGRIDRLVGGASVAAVVGTVALWRWLLCSASAPRLALRMVRRTAEAVAVRFPQFGATLRRRLPHDADVLVGAQHRARAVLGRSGAFLLLSAIAAQVVLALLLVSCAAALAPSATVPMLAVLRSFALLRVLSSFVPVPGGLGVVDLGLVATLQGSGMDVNTAVAAVALFRGLTFVLPLVTGPLCAAIWWVRTPRHRTTR
jgi:uncharacterized membrane protein YbhN (UPF0104 family)